MKTKCKQRQRFTFWVNLRSSLLLLGTFLTSGIAVLPMMGQVFEPKSYQPKYLSSKPDAGYTQVGDTRVYYNASKNFDIIGRFQESYYGSTYSNGGYRLALKVNDGSARQLSCTGDNLDGVAYRAWVEAQGELARVCYEFVNTTSEAVRISAGTHADVMIGSNDRAPISRRIDTMGNTYGVTMSDGSGAQLCILFGTGLKGVTSVNDFWFGHYSQNRDAFRMVGEYSQGSNWMEENGSYDSGMGWCWKDRSIAAGDTLVLSYLIGVGEVNLQPNSNVEVTPEDPEGWNDLSRPHRLTLAGTYDSPAGLDGLIEYAVEDTDNWISLTDTLSSGTDFSQSIVVNFTEGRPLHTIHLRTVDAVGNTTNMHPIEYVDIAGHEFSGLRDYVYTGDSLYQTSVSSDLPDEQYVLKNYRNNLNAGIASFNVEGVFPHTIGRSTYQFVIKPQPLRGQLVMADTAYVYSGQSITPKWQFSDAAYAFLEEGKDYVKQLTNSVLPGKATLIVSGKGNYTASLSANYDIDKAPLRDELFSVTLPPSDITYDGLPHTAQVTKNDGVGDIHIQYALLDMVFDAPTDEGTYEVYATIDEGSLYYGRPYYYLGTFSIYGMDEQEWHALTLLNQWFASMSDAPVWDMSQGIKGASSLRGIVINGGHVKMLDLSNRRLVGPLPDALYQLSQVEDLDLSHNRLTGNVGVIGQSMPNLKTLNVSDNAFADLFPMLPSSVSSLNIGKQHIDKTIVLDGSSFDMASIMPQIPTIMAYNHAMQKYDTDISLAISTASTIDSLNQTGVWTVYANFANGQLSFPYVSSSNVYYGVRGDTLKAFKLTSSFLPDGSECKLKYIFDSGDSNFKPGVDATDLQATILYIFDSYGLYPFNHTAADTYRDGIINVQDVVSTVNILLSQQPNEALLSNAMRSDYESLQADVEAYVYFHDGKVWLYSERPVAALSVCAVGNIDWNLRAQGMEQSTRDANLVAYSLGNKELPANVPIELGSYSGMPHILSASLSDVSAQAVPTSLTALPTTGINQHPTDSSVDSNMEIYNLQGIPSKAMQKGVNLVKKNGIVKKVIVK